MAAHSPSSVRKSTPRSVKDLVRTVVYLPAMTPVSGEFFICSFPRYMTPDILFRFLRREITTHKSKAAGPLQLVAMWIRLRGRADFPRGSKLLDRLLSLIQTLSTDAEAAALVPRLNEVKLALLSALPRRLMKNVAPPPDTPVAIFTFPTAQIAEQLTRVDHAAFAAVPLEDFLEKRWEMSNRSSKLRDLVERSNRMSDWVASCVLVQSTNHGQAKAAERFLEIAHLCLGLGNFYAVAGIMSGFGQWSVSRLTRTWHIRSQHKLLHQFCMASISPDKNYQGYRPAVADHMAQRKPCVPHVAVFLRDLTFIEDGNLDWGADNLPNQKKIGMVGALIAQIHRMQTTTYDEESETRHNPALTHKLAALPRRSLDWLEKRSKELRPMATESDTSMEASTRSDQDVSDESAMPLDDINDAETASSSSNNSGGGGAGRVDGSTVSSRIKQ